MSRISKQHIGNLLQITYYVVLLDNSWQLHNPLHDTNPSTKKTWSFCLFCSYIVEVPTRAKRYAYVQLLTFLYCYLGIILVSNNVFCILLLPIYDSPINILSEM
ncbi:hypothetical protein MUK42_37249 [Musa troglodytarum]|uniref:Uncharacterized protein n=1 Tax=Musa troglodytarum TaxID=320322 RepID=A0A9E7JT50_9LILI|nr:hypothetical protein MUK42_37249 [Musa troglodytarum]